MSPNIRIMKVLFFSCIFVIAASASLLAEQRKQFQIFKVKYNKYYRNQAEEIKRFNVFMNTLNTIEQHNILYEQNLVSYKKGVNRFADVTQEEFKAMLTLTASTRPQFNSTKHVQTGLPIANSIDWRTKGQVTEVKDQKDCGACWAFSITGSTEAAYARKSGKLVSLSEQQLIDCSVGINYGCGGGFLENTFPYIEKYGLQTEKSYPFISIDASCNYNASEVVTTVSEYKVIDTNDEDALLDAVANIGPVSVGMDATFITNYESGIFDDYRCSKDQLGHGVLIVGYGTENNVPFWIVKNSWGKSWGEQGYFRIKRGCNECGIAKDTVYPTCN